MKPLVWIGLVITLLGVVSCSGDSAETLFETAKLEEMQRNFTHAETLYKEIIRKYPNSPLARSATERLTAMKQNAPQ